MIKLLQRKNLVTLRNLVQSGFALFLLYVGYEFYGFVRYFDLGETTVFSARPPAVEGFLPVNALVSLKSWLANGIFDPVHPAGLTIFVAIILISILYKKGFCSWLCPVGALSEAFGRLGQKLFGRTFKLPALLDLPLRTLKYLLLFFFINFIFLGMDGQAAFVYTTQVPYIKVADAKMLDFFLNLSTFAVLTLAFLALASVFIQNFWCRYLCPYGALLGLVSFISPVKVSRDQGLCTDCGRCNKACHANIKVSEQSRISSPECNGCLNCVAACPVSGALEITLPGKNKGESSMLPWQRVKLPGWAMALMVLGTFLLIVFIAKGTGHWESSITMDEFRTLLPQRNIIEH